MTTSTDALPSTRRPKPNPRPIGPLSLMGLLFRQVLGRQTLQRRPEPDEVMNVTESVSEYTEVMQTKLAITYAIGWDTVYRARQANRSGLAVDYCSGPGVFSVGLAEILGYERVHGIDLAPRMIEASSANAAARGHHERVTFSRGDVTHRSELPSGSADLTTFFDAAHHLPNLDAVRAVMAEMERVTHPEGLIVALDLARLANAALTERYVATLGSDYEQLGLPHFLEDFRHSMYAAWTVDELATTIPADSSRRWVQLIPFGLPAMQFVIGLPEGRRELFVQGKMQPSIARCIPESFHGDLKMVQQLLRFGRRRELGLPQRTEH